MAYVAGAFFTATTFFMPVINRQPFWRRLLFSSLPGYYFYSWTLNHGKNLWWGRNLAAHKKLVLNNNGYDTAPSLWITLFQKDIYIILT